MNSNLVIYGHESALNFLKAQLHECGIVPGAINGVLTTATDLMQSGKLVPACHSWEEVCYGVAIKLANTPAKAGQLETVFQGVSAGLALRTRTFFADTIGRAIPSAANAAVATQALQHLHHSGAPLETLKHVLERASKHAGADIATFKARLGEVIKATSFSDTVSHANVAAGRLADTLMNNGEVAAVANAAGKAEKMSFAKSLGCVLLGTVSLSVFISKTYEAIKGSYDLDPDGKPIRNWSLTLKNTGIAALGAAGTAAAFWLGDKHSPSR